MKIKLLLLTAAFFGSILSAQAQNQDSLMLRKIFDESLVNGQSYQNLRYLCKNIGGRLSGSANAQKAVEWGKKLMNSYGFDKVYLQEVMVPHWERGEKEQGYIISGGKKIPVHLAALGMSIATPKDGITAEVIEVHSLDEVNKLGDKVKGKIVFYNRPFDPRFIQTLQAYGTANDQRGGGPSLVAKYGAVGALVRSMTEADDDFPHTGGTRIVKDGPNVPAAALSTKAANLLSETLKSSKTSVKFFLKQSCRQLPDALSYNVVGEIKGSRNPNKYITVGGHLDSWDLAEGAHDDGTGVTQSVEALRILKTLGYKPQNSLRVVFFMNEENGSRGGQKYAELAAQNKEEHIAAIESDLGGFTPRGFSFDGIDANQLKQIRQSWGALLEPYNANKLTEGEGGTDIGPLRQKFPKMMLIGFMPDPQRYFDIHHTPNDVFENVNKRELELGAAAMASLVYLLDK